MEKDSPMSLSSFSSNTSKFIQVNSTKIWFETMGSKNNPPLLLINGNSSDAFMWPWEFCKMLVDSGFYVIRYDQRDTGLSTHVDFSQNPYTLIDMAEDALAILDDLEFSKAHILGYSTGGAIAQILAVHHPDRVASLTLMMTSVDLTIKTDAFLGKDTSNASLSAPSKEYIEAVVTVARKEAHTPQEKIHRSVEQFKLANGHKASFDASYFYELFENSINRAESSGNKGHNSNHALATAATQVLTRKELGNIALSTLVVAGEEDPIFPPDHPSELARVIPDAKLFIVKDLGHIINPLFCSTLVTAIGSHIKQQK